jgi:hypothetical protein
VEGERVTVTAINSSSTDSFPRTVSGGWGTADTGEAWTVSGTAGDYAVGSGAATMSHSAANAIHTAVLAVPSLAETMVLGSTSIPALASGSAIQSALITRYQDASNYYYLGCRFETTGVLNATIARRVGGVVTVTNVAVGTYTAGTLYRIRALVLGSTLMVRVWSTLNPEPAVWHVTVTDANLATGQVGFFSILSSGSTNTTPFAISFDNLAVVNPQDFTVTRSVNGVVKAHNAGAPVKVWKPAGLAL